MTVYSLSHDQPEGEINTFSNLLKIWQYLNAWAVAHDHKFFNYRNFARLMQGKVSHTYQVGDKRYIVERKAVL